MRPYWIVGLLLVAGCVGTFFFYRDRPLRLNDDALGESLADFKNTILRSLAKTNSQSRNQMLLIDG